MSIEENAQQYRAYVKLLNKQVTVSIGGKESVVFPVSKNIPSDVLSIVSCNFSLYGPAGNLITTGAGSILGTMIACFQVDATALSPGLHKLVGTITLSNTDVLKDSICVEVKNA
jgi:hypothetical protein